MSTTCYSVSEFIDDMQSIDFTDFDDNEQMIETLANLIKKEFDKDEN